jgi:phage terminase large subunit-like protein
VIKDELHEFREKVHRKFLDTMDTGGGSRCQPIDIVTTTAGDDSSQIWLEVYRYFAGVSKGDIVDESCFGYCFEIDEKDDPLDESNWVKANPNLGMSVKVEYLRDQAIQAKQSPSKLNQFIRYHGNRMVSATTRAFDLELWDDCRGRLSDWRKADAVGIGVDIGSRDDLTALGMVARFPTGEKDDNGDPVWRFEIRAGAYISSDTPRDLSVPPWSRWIYDDYLSRTKFPNVELKDDILENCRAYRPFAVAYDPYNGLVLSDELTKHGINAVAMAQTCAMFHEPIQEFRQAMRDGRLKHDGNPVLRWCIGNAAIVRDRQDRWMFSKRDSDEKIDCAVAVVMAYRMAMLAPKRPTGRLVHF